MKTPPTLSWAADPIQGGIQSSYASETGHESWTYLSVTFDSEKHRWRVLSGSASPDTIAYAKTLFQAKEIAQAVFDEHWNEWHTQNDVIESLLS